MLNKPLEVLPGAWQITLPLPFELSSVNVYLVRVAAGWMLVDCGLGTEESFNELQAQLDFLGVEWKAITEIFLTHTHPDHVGQAKRLLALTGACISMQKEELAQLQRLSANGGELLWLHGTLRRAKVPEEMIRKIDASFQKIRPNFPQLTPDRVFEGGEALESALGPLELVLTPGHSPGHLCLYSRDHRILFAGDHILEAITPHIGWLPERDALADFFRSLDLVRPLAIDRVLPGHGAVFEGHEAWIAATVLHHDERCGQIRSALQGGPKSAYELVSDLWKRTLAPFHLRFAVFEALAHLEYLLRRGEVTVEPQEGYELWRLPG